MLVTSLPIVASCASTPGAKPHDMSAAQHETTAAREEKSADLHAAQYEPNATVKRESCSRAASARYANDVGCWTSIVNPTDEHREQAKKHHQMAADHRTASMALRDAEARACSGISEYDRDESPFLHREDITSVEPLIVPAGSGTTSGKAQYTRTVGAVITFRAVPWLTAQWLQRVIDCHLARNAALGHDVPEMSYCPLVPKNVSAKVSETSTGFAVSVRSEDAQTAQEVLRRARALTSR